jgi:hypothetical protein
VTTRTAQAIQWLDTTPGATQVQAAARYGIKQPTISAAIAARRKAGQCPEQRATLAERERCATLARAMGAQGVALAIINHTNEVTK